MREELISAILALPPSSVTAMDPRNGSSTLTLADGGLTAEVRGDRPATDREVDAFLERNGYEPDAWRVTSMKRSEWTKPNGELGVSTRYSFAPVFPIHLDIDDLIESARKYPDVVPMCETGSGVKFVVAIGDPQIGKADGDGVEGTVTRLINYIDRARLALDDISEFGVDHVHIAWLGDHIEGFESQSGKNAWRTPLGLTDQLRIVRRLMMYSVGAFADAAPRVTVTAVPGNHGRVTANGGMTKFSDNFDVDCMVAVADACAMFEDKFGHVRFLFPEEDEMTVEVEVGGVRIAHAHGNQWQPGKHFDWWQGQAFGGRHGSAKVLLAGHLHHLLVETWGDQWFIQVPAIESESTWYRHRKGVPGSPGIVTFQIRNGRPSMIDVIQ